MQSVPVFLTVTGKREVYFAGATLTERDGTKEISSECRFVPAESGSVRLNFAGLQTNAQIAKADKLRSVSIIASDDENLIMPEWTEMTVISCKCCCTRSHLGIPECVTGLPPCKCC